MPSNIGSSAVVKFMVGSSEVSAVYHGSTDITDYVTGLMSSDGHLLKSSDNLYLLGAAA